MIAECRDIASSTGTFSRSIFSIFGTIPEVEIVIFLLDIFIPFSLDSISRAFKTFVRFKSGSPIPINTILFKFVPCFTSLLSIV